MTNIDTKLREIAEFCFNRGVGAANMDDIEDVDERDKAYLNVQRKTKDEAIAQIKSCFVEDGWTAPNTKAYWGKHGDKLYFVNGADPIKRVDLETLMTGQEWLSRFEAEVMHGDFEPYKLPKVLEHYPIKTAKNEHFAQYIQGQVLEAAKRASGITE